MRLLKEEYNPVTGITRRYYLRPDGKSTVQGLQDADPIFNANKEQLGAKSAKATKLNEREGLGTKVASIPMGLVEQILQERGVNLITCSDAQLKAIINDVEFNKIRTAHGRV